jgi:two-component system alkaline phosphatase synthesis response regulator PhoP
MTRTILVVDDKASLRAMVKDYLTEQNFRVVTAANGQEALFVARYEKPDLILLDIMMPEMDGYEFIRIFGKEQETPIILLTAKLEETDKVLGLEMGADDYITKPFGMRELLARIHAVLRRSEKSAVTQNVLRIADIILDKDQRLVTGITRWST